MSKLPTIFLSHGGGPCFFMETDSNSLFNPMDKNSEAAKWYRQVATQLKITNPPENVQDASLWQKPKALLIISAHWETSGAVYVTSQTDYKSLYYDYYGFPKYTYELKYPAKGDLELSKHVVSLLNDSGIKAEFDNKRNFDHGVFVPMLLVYPNADIPIVQLSINSNLDPNLHVQIGKTLAPLREQGVLIIGSGQSTHDMSRTLTPQRASKFIESLVNLIQNKSPVERLNGIINWKNLPHGKEAHPREEHLIPLHVVIGAAGEDKGHLLNNHWGGTFALHSFAFY